MLRRAVLLIAALVPSTSLALPGFEIGAECASVFAEAKRSGAIVVEDENATFVKWSFRGSPMSIGLTCDAGRIATEFLAISYDERAHAIAVFHEFREELERAMGKAGTDLSDPRQQAELRESLSRSGETLEGVFPNFDDEWEHAAYWSGASLSASPGFGELGPWVVTLRR